MEVGWEDITGVAFTWRRQLPRACMTLEGLQGSWCETHLLMFLLYYLGRWRRVDVSLPLLIVGGGVMEGEDISTDVNEHRTV